MAELAVIACLLPIQHAVDTAVLTMTRNFEASLVNNIRDLWDASEDLASELHIPRGGQAIISGLQARRDVKLNCLRSAFKRSPHLPLSRGVPVTRRAGADPSEAQARKSVLRKHLGDCSARDAGRIRGVGAGERGQRLPGHGRTPGRCRLSTGAEAFRSPDTLLLPRRVPTCRSLPPSVTWPAVSHAPWRPGFFSAQPSAPPTQARYRTGIRDAVVSSATGSLRGAVPRFPPSDASFVEPGAFPGHAGRAFMVAVQGFPLRRMASALMINSLNVTERKELVTDVARRRASGAAGLSITVRPLLRQRRGGGAYTFSCVRLLPARPLPEGPGHDTKSPVAPPPSLLRYQVEDFLEGVIRPVTNFASPVTWTDPATGVAEVTGCVVLKFLWADVLATLLSGSARMDVVVFSKEHNFDYAEVGLPAAGFDTSHFTFRVANNTVEHVGWGERCFYFAYFAGVAPNHPHDGSSISSLLKQRSLRALLLAAAAAVAGSDSVARPIPFAGDLHLTLPNHGAARFARRVDIRMGFSEFQFTLYPTQDMRDEFITNLPLHALLVVVLLVCGIVAFFAASDALARRRFNALFGESEAAGASFCAHQEALKARHGFVSMVSHGAESGRKNEEAGILHSQILLSDPFSILAGAPVALSHALLGS